MIYKAYRFMGVKGGVKGSDGVKVAPRGSTGRFDECPKEQRSIRDRQIEKQTFSV